MRGTRGTPPVGRRDDRELDIDDSVFVYLPGAHDIYVADCGRCIEASRPARAEEYAGLMERLDDYVSGPYEPCDERTAAMREEADLMREQMRSEFGLPRSTGDDEGTSDPRTASRDGTRAADVVTAVPRGKRAIQV